MMEAEDDRGMIQRGLERVFGKRANLLTEKITGAPWLSYLLIIGQSIATVFVFGRSEVGGLWAPDLTMRVMATLLLFLLGVTVIAADDAMLRSFSRLEALRRNRQYGQWLEHVAYILFVLVVEGSTYGVVLIKTESDPTALTSGQPLIPTNGPWFMPLIALRVILTAWSLIQLPMVHKKLSVLTSTLNNTGKEILGGHLERAIKGINIGHMSIAGMHRTFYGMAQPPRPIPGFWNFVTGGWIVERAKLKEAEEWRQAQIVNAGLAEMERSAQTPLLDAPAIVPQDVPQDAPKPPDDGPGGGVPTRSGVTSSNARISGGTGNMSPFPKRANPKQLSPTAETVRERRAFDLLDAGATNYALKKTLRCGEAKAKQYRAAWEARRNAQQAG